MNMRNVIKRCGVIFIFLPLFICLLFINMIIWLSVFIWGPFYYIITGNDPLSLEFESYGECFSDWYFNKFGPDE